jgi:HEAT repeat protein
VAKELIQLAPLCGVQIFESQILPVLNLLVEDPDRDVRNYAENALYELKTEFLARKEN